jgi:hypothetical protein
MAAYLERERTVAGANERLDAAMVEADAQLATTDVILDVVDGDAGVSTAAIAEQLAALEAPGRVMLVVLTATPTSLGIRDWRSYLGSERGNPRALMSASRAPVTLPLRRL